MERQKKALEAQLGISGLSKWLGEKNTEMD